MHARIDFPFARAHFNTRALILLNRSSVSCEAESQLLRSWELIIRPPSGAEQVKVMNLIQVPDKRLLFKATVPLIFRCAYWLRHGAERKQKSP